MWLNGERMRNLGDGMNIEQSPDLIYSLDGPSPEEITYGGFKMGKILASGSMILSFLRM